MPTFVTGDMWSRFGNTDLFLVTTNPILKKDGSVVMGRGIAKQMKDRFPAFPYMFGNVLENRPGTTVSSIGRFDGQLCGIFMVKDHWASPAKPAIIEQSAKDLACMSGVFGRIDLNFPGIGNGKLRREDVAPLLDILPEHVFIWEL